MAREIDVTDTVDKWRYVCPEGHRSWEVTPNYFWCKICSNHETGLDGTDSATFEELRDLTDESLVHRDDVVINEEREFNAHTR